MQEAFAAALAQWPLEGTPANPRAWLVSAGRNKAVDSLRRCALLEEKREELARWLALAQPVADAPEETMGARASGVGAEGRSSSVFLVLFWRRHQRGDVDSGYVMGDDTGLAVFEVGQHYDRKLVIHVTGDIGIESLP